MTNRDRLLELVAKLTNYQLAGVLLDIADDDDAIAALEKEYCASARDNNRESCTHKADGVLCVECIADWLGQESN